MPENFRFGVTAVKYGQKELIAAKESKMAMQMAIASSTCLRQVWGSRQRIVQYKEIEERRNIVAHLGTQFHLLQNLPLEGQQDNASSEDDRKRKNQQTRLMTDFFREISAHKRPMTWLPWNQLTLEVLNARVGYADTVTRIAREYLFKARVEYPRVSQLIEERFWYEVEALARVTNHKSLVKDFGCMTDLYEAGNPPDLEIGTFQMAMWAFIADPKGYKATEQHTVELLRCLVMPNARQIPSPDYQERFGSDDQLEVLLQKSKDYPEGYNEKENLRKFVETQEALYMRQHEHRAAVLQYLVECERCYGEIIEKQHSVEQQRRVQQRRQEESDKREEKKDLRVQQKFIKEQQREEANRFERERHREQEYAEQERAAQERAAQERAEYERAKQELREQERLEQEQMEQKRSRREREHKVPEQLGEHPEHSLFGAGPNEGFNPFDGGDEAVDNLFDDSAPTPLRWSKCSGPSHELTGMDSGQLIPLSLCQISR
ncbi:hypothetical protein BT96DRAFT_950023 [Gymnopus androsaceus JB14]|uniref:Uncharacterized protein n=1 Tax=Gymnopus androsaceus JB14 TaxID=1447944 RepID=A0A6A4GHS7_9AGAR|nr:hypothetical protein BT96DRAFT_950023 [Gymnopus androsaceus JB14]